MSAQKATRILVKPKMRGLLNSQIKRNLTIILTNCVLVGMYMKFVFGDSRKRAYAEFYKNYDAEEEFEKMRQKGLFQSC